MPARRRSRLGRGARNGHGVGNGGEHGQVVVGVPEDHDLIQAHAHVIGEPPHGRPLVPATRHDVGVGGHGAVHVEGAHLGVEARDELGHAGLVPAEEDVGLHHRKVRETAQLHALLAIRGEGAGKIPTRA